MPTPRKVAFATLGCKLNYAETSAIARKFADEGFQRTPFSQKADIYVINTCTVTQAADKKCRNLISKALRNKPGAIVAVVGCYAQLRSRELAELGNVDIVLGTKEKFDILRYIKEFDAKRQNIIQTCNIEQVNQFIPANSISDRTRAFLKIQDGCDYKCSYCTVPLARGRSRNEPISVICNQVNELTREGIKEIVLTGVNIGDFGKSTGETFLDLIRELDTTAAVVRFRISSIEPNLLTDEIVDFIAGSNHFVPHFHIPLQSGCDTVLAAMRRRYKREVFASRVQKIVERMPHACIGADVISGFPGETEEHFNQTFEFLKNLPVSYLHAFTYSERDNTPAAYMPGKVAHAVREERTHRFISLSEEKRRAFYLAHLGTTRKVLFESARKEGLMSGFTDNYIRVEIPYDASMVNKEISIRLLKINSSGNVLGEISS